MSNMQRRFTGYALVIGGALAIVGYLAAGLIAGDSGNAHFTDPQFQPLYSIALAGGVLTVLGLPAVLVAQAGRFPRLTAVGYTGTMAGLLMLNIGEGIIEGFVKPYLVTHGGIPNPEPAGFAAWEAVGLACAIVGLICLGVAVVRARTMPRWVGVLMAASPILSLALGGQPAPIPELSDICLSLALIAIGWRVAVPAQRQSARSGVRITTPPEAATPNS